MISYRLLVALKIKLNAKDIQKSYFEKLVKSILAA